MTADRIKKIISLDKLYSAIWAWDSLGDLREKQFSIQIGEGLKGEKI